ncbi:hypothetical protein C3489_28010 [Streptomyces sp. Ru71]|uniref:DUF4344 domain-containing metallopeptidase n=1 Tax=Streptomyces sp. Ru71 TaxID=2080746 RepID=UPI000CDDF72D|nr:DUF4344 domain-containing metallopeptidase [Streptomyces sp. Ru71]POX48084.1 hypothetical protein C3489_28010 [Streptomyces sp. Ru71]
MSRRGAGCWMLLAVLAGTTGGCGTHGASGGDRPPSAAARQPAQGGFVVRYGSVGPDLAADLAFLRSGRVPETVAERLDARVRMPRSVTFAVHGCGDADPAYDPDARRIDVCVEQVGDVRDRFTAGGADDGDAAVAAVVEETLLHESAHALLDVLRLPFTGREEDVADQFAAVMLIGQGRAGEDKVLTAAREYALSAKETPPTDADLLDEHSLDGQRAAGYACYVYGARPDRHGDLVDGRRLTEDRAETCADEYRQARRGWEALLRPHLVRPL